MRLLLTPCVLLSILCLCFATGCTQEISREQLAEKVGQPADVQFFGDRALYMGDADGYRYVHVRDMYDFTTFLGECEYKIPESQWPVAHPMPLTCNPTHWQDVSWMNADAPAGVPQDAFLHMTPAFPLGAPATQPATTNATRPQ